jgi:hypothetical protein
MKQKTLNQMGEKMRKVILLLLGILLLGFLKVSAQEVSLTTYGVSPYNVTQDSIEHYFDRRYSGLLNVGIETKVFLEGSSTVTLVNPQWTLLSAPGGSTATLGTTKDMDTSNQIITFTPDVEGAYKIAFSDGVAADTVTINAALYFGVSGGVVACQTCHSDTYTKWTTTLHSTAAARGFDGSLSSHFNQSCLDCHTTGNDPNAANDGFDDFPFVFPDSLYPGVNAQLIAAYPDAMARSNVQCEACHGPGSGHLGQITDSKIDVTLNSDVCAYCHENGTHEIKPLQWDTSVHANGPYQFAGPSRYTCTPCHNGEGFIQYVKGQPQSADVIVPITCATCHDPHSKENSHQLRLVSATLQNGYVFNGEGGLCANCHQARTEAVSYVNDYLSHTSHYGPHHGPQADMLSAQNAYTWGQSLGTSPHLYVTENACIDCHMYNIPAPLGQIPNVGGHTFAMVSSTGEENVESCNQDGCHSGITTFEEKKFFLNGNADLDGDGVANGLQIEVQGLLDTLAMHLPPYGSTDIGDIDSTWTLNEAGAYYNYGMVNDDRSLGIHNARFTVELLYLSIAKIGGPVLAVDNANKDLPTDFALAQNYPNPFNPTTKIQYQLPQGSNVKVVVYDALGKQVAVLVNEFQSAGTYTTNFNASNLASGIYFCRMEAGNFVKVNKMLLLK